MKLILDYEPDLDEFTVKIDSKSKYSDRIIGRGDSIEDSVSNLITTLTIFLKCYEGRDRLYRTLSRWLEELGFVARIRIRMTKRMSKSMNLMTRLKVKDKLINIIHR